MNNDFHNDIDEKTNEISSKAGRRASRKILKMGMRAGKFTGKILLSTIKSILPFIIVPLLFIGLAALSYFMIFEFIGSEKEYSKMYENKVEKREDGIYYVKKDGLKGENSVIQDYYKYISGQSYSMSVGKDNEAYKPDDDEVKDVKDYYGREKDFNLAPNLLFALDEHLYNWKFKYSEQFIKPVAYDKKTFDLLPLVDKAGKVIVKSKKEDMETGEKTGEEIVSVRDYGLGSVLKYNIKEDYKRVEKIKGTYVKKEIWNGEKVEKVAINEDFEVELKTEDIYLIDKATLFTGNVNYEYTKRDLELEKLKRGVGQKETDKTTSYVYKVHEEKHYEIKTVTNSKTGETKKKKVYVRSTFHPLLKYRNEESAVYENVPVVSNTVVENTEFDYFQSYLNNFEVYVPKDVITEFNFDKRIDYNSHIFDYDAFLVDDYGLGIGLAKDTEKANYAKQFLPLIAKNAKDFNVDPYIILAIMTQESGGHSTPGGDGIMQLNGGDSNGTKVISATNANGEKETLSITQAEKSSDNDKAIRYGVMFFKNLLEEMDGNPYKAIQAYNFGAAGMREIKKMNAEAWDSEYGWLIYREAARLKRAPAGYSSASYSCMAFPEGTMQVVPGKLYGNSCHLEMVLQYYSGDKMASVEMGKDNAWTGVVDAAKTAGKKFLSFIIPRQKDELIPKFEHINYLSNGRVLDVLGTTKALDKEILFSEAISFVGEASASNFWENGYMDSLESVGLSLNELINIAPNSDGYLPPINMEGRKITSYFGSRVHPITKAKDFHYGVDVAAPTGTPLYAVADGEVKFSAPSGTAGNLVIIKHENGTEAVYMHLSVFGVRQGQKVKQGDEIGKVGTTGASTGPHLHFGLKVNGSYVDGLGILLGR